MDSEHRHELQENILARWLTEKLEVVKPHLPMILLGFGAAAVGSMAWTSWTNSADQAEEQAWQSYADAVNLGMGERTLAVLEKIGDEKEFEGSTVTPWAEITWADGQLLTASQTYLRNRESALAALERAETKYKSIVADGKAPREVRQRAQFGLARVEDLRGDVEAALAAYGKVAGAFQKLAEDRIEELEEAAVAEDVVWLASAEATPMRSPLGAGAPVQQPDSTPDPLALPAEESASPVSAADSLTEMLKNIEASAAEQSTEEEVVEEPADATAESAEADATEPPAEEGAAEEEAAAAESEEAEE